MEVLFIVGGGAAGKMIPGAGRRPLLWGGFIRPRGRTGGRCALGHPDMYISIGVWHVEIAFLKEGGRVTYACAWRVGSSTARAQKIDAVAVNRMWLRPQWAAREGEGRQGDLIR